ncbi:Tryptophan--tRNA ligase (fragment) [Capnocytophaga canimorsus]|uniref:Tryptophan--tRNA ligase n=1 Tax=Capnocytophaga canimorsus TaxID=28188 RepID=A0A0B7IM08_9FLAO
MRSNYLAGNYGYGHTKQALFELMLEKFAEPRQKFNYYMENLEELDKILQEGALKAQKTANEVLKRVRKKVGY